MNLKMKENTACVRYSTQNVSKGNVLGTSTTKGEKSGLKCVVSPKRQKFYTLCTLNRRKGGKK